MLRDADLYAFQFRGNTPPEVRHPENPHTAFTLAPGEGNPRNSEGDFIRLKDGRTMFIYTKFSGSTSDHASASLMARYSTDEGRTWSEPTVCIADDDIGYLF